MKLHEDISYDNKEMEDRNVTRLINTFNKLPQRIQDIHKDFYLYHNFIFRNMAIHGLITCPIHGDFPQTMSNHLQGYGCKKCATDKNKLAQTKSTAQFIVEAMIVHGDKYDYSLVEYTGATNNVTIICKEHGPFPQTPSHHLNGSGCSDCAESGFNPNIPAILYYICIDEEYYKIGVTNRTTELRYGKTKMKKIRIVKEWNYNIGREAHTEEQRIVNEFRKHLVKVNPIEDTKSREIFNHDILQLDN